MPKSDAANREHLQNFTDALMYLGTLWRTANDEPDFGKSMSWWCKGANFWHQNRGGSADVRPSVIMAACVACGIAHTYGPRFPFDASVGLSIGGGKPITGADWFHFLETRTLRPASELPPRLWPLPAQRAADRRERAAMTAPTFASELILRE